jgi:hypothetical protein
VFLNLESIEVGLGVSMQRFLAVLAVMLCLFSVNGAAQSRNARLGGTVADASGALIPGVEVKATNDGTGIVTTVISNEAGNYQFASLEPGIYTVSGSLTGFQIQTYTKVELGISQQVRLNFTLQVSGAAQAVEVTVAADTLIATTSASIGAVLPDYKVSDLPIANRNVLDLVATTPGARGDTFAGLPNTMTMTTRDGIPVNLGRPTPGTNQVATTTFSSPDLVEQVRVIISPADAEFGRGSGQVQLQTRSGTNEFRGALFWTNRNAVWDASTSSNNFRGVPKNYINRNQFGGRLGGPIVRNKTFFFFLYEGQRRLEKQSTVATVLTEPAKQGIFRFFAGRQNGNFTAAATTRSVEVDGSLNASLNPANLRQVNVFNFDPNRSRFDPSGYVQRFLAAMPVANDFTTGDGLNTAGHRWLRRSYTGNGTSEGSRDGVNLKLDHQFNRNHKMSLVASREKAWADAQTSNWPNGFHGTAIGRPATYTGSFVSTLSPTLLNEFRFGLRRGRLDTLQAFDHPETGAEARQFLGFSPGPGGPESPGGTPFLIDLTLIGKSAIINDANGSVGNTSPLWTYADNISWSRGVHNFKGGVEFRYGNSDAWNSDEIIPRVHFGPDPGRSTALGTYYCPACGVPVQGIDTTTVTGLHANDVQRFRNLATDLSGAVANISQAFSLQPDPKNIKWLDYPNYYKKYRDFHQNEFMTFFKDDWKLSNNLTLNLGVRWEWYGVPYEADGMMARPKGGNLFGLSGSSFADWYRPGERGELTTYEFVGKYSPNPDVPLFNNDWNNFAPAVGFSYSMPWFQRATVLRAGYGINYQGRLAGGDSLGIDINVGTAPGLNHFANYAITSPAEMSLNNVRLPIPGRHPDGFLPVVPVTERMQQIVMYDINQRNSYVQNLNAELQRELARDLTLEIRYVGSKGTKLLGNININNPIVVENGLLEAARITREGGNSALFENMLRGLNFAGIGTVGANGLTGSSALRRFSGTRAFIANGNVTGLANYLNTNSSFTGQVGGMLRHSGLPENFIVANPQFGVANIAGALNNSTYHSLQTGVTKRLSRGFTNQTTYTWSRTLGAGGNIDPRNRQLNKTLSGNHRTHDIRSNGTWLLPFGPGRMLLSSSPGWVSRLVEGWQFGGIFSWSSGAPLTVTAGDNPLGGGATSQFPDIVGNFPKSTGKLTASDVAGNRQYFEGFQLVNDPGAAAVTTADALNTAYARFALADSSGNIVLQPAAFGQIGNMGQNWIEGPGTIGLDMNLMKRVRIDEAKTFILRLDAVNVLNHPSWGNPNVMLNSTSFGLVALPTTGNRQFTFNLRLEF